MFGGGRGLFFGLGLANMLCGSWAQGWMLLLLDLRISLLCDGQGLAHFRRVQHFTEVCSKWGYDVRQLALSFIGFNL